MANQATGLMIPSGSDIRVGPYLFTAPSGDPPPAAAAGSNGDGEAALLVVPAGGGRGRPLLLRGGQPSAPRWACRGRGRRCWTQQPQESCGEARARARRNLAYLRAALVLVFLGLDTRPRSMLAFLALCFGRGGDGGRLRREAPTAAAARSRDDAFDSVQRCFFFLRDDSL